MTNTASDEEVFKALKESFKVNNKLSKLLTDINTEKGFKKMVKTFINTLNKSSIVETVEEEFFFRKHIHTGIELTLDVILKYLIKEHNEWSQKYSNSDYKDISSFEKLNKNYIIANTNVRVKTCEETCITENIYITYFKAVKELRFKDCRIHELDLSLFSNLKKISFIECIFEKNISSILVTTESMKEIDLEISDCIFLSHIEEKVMLDELEKKHFSETNEFPKNLSINSNPEEINSIKKVVLTGRNKTLTFNSRYPNCKQLHIKKGAPLGFYAKMLSSEIEELYYSCDSDYTEAVETKCLIKGYEILDSLTNLTLIANNLVDNNLFNSLSYLRAITFISCNSISYFPVSLPYLESYCGSHINLINNTCLRELELIAPPSVVRWYTIIGSPELECLFLHVNKNNIEAINSLIREASIIFPRLELLKLSFESNDLKVNIEDLFKLKRVCVEFNAEQNSSASISFKNLPCLDSIVNHYKSTREVIDRDYSDRRFPEASDINIGSGIKEEIVITFFESNSHRSSIKIEGNNFYDLTSSNEILLRNTV